MPSVDSMLAFWLTKVRISPGGADLLKTVCFCSELNECNNANAASVSSLNGCLPFCGPLGTTAGFAPRKPGVPLISVLFIAEKLNEIWWPSNLQPQLFAG